MDVSIDNGRYNAKVRLYLPHDFDENKKYPLLVNVYAGPNSQQVNDRYSAYKGTIYEISERDVCNRSFISINFSILSLNKRFKLDWGTYLTTSESVIYAVIDGRGSGYRGNDLLHEIYYKLGQPEVQDQIDVTKRLVDQYAFIDASNVAIWGWSYGSEYLYQT